jgi:rhodanese-related sulfurtransferase
MAQAPLILRKQSFATRRSLAPPNPVDLAGMIAGNVLRGDAPLAEWEELTSADALLIDVRQPEEFAAGHIEGAINLPLPQLHSRLGELPHNREIWLNCGIGQRSYYALRILLQHGFKARNLSGGFTTYKSFRHLLRDATGTQSSD